MSGAIEALVFDFDGLILDTEVPEFLTVRAVFEAHGLTLELEDWTQRVGRADLPHWMDWLEERLGEPIPDREAVKLQRMERHHALIAANDLLAGVVELLDAAGERGMPVGVASSSTRSWVEGHLDERGVLDRFATVVTSDQVERAKPWPDLYLEACRRLDVDPADAVAFEDSSNGSLAAKAAGLYCVVVPNTITGSQDFAHADLVVSSLLDVTIESLSSAR